MKLKAIRLAPITLCLFAATSSLHAAPLKDPCELPQKLGTEIATKYPGTKVVTLDDLTPDNQKFFQKDHGGNCPGLAKVDFYGDGSQTLAFVLVARTSAKEKSYLMVAHLVGTIWKIRMLDTDDGAPTPVVWAQPAGKYRDVDRGKEIQATRPVIVFAGYEAFAIVYAWTGTGVSKVWIAD
ncbi:MAG: hypothetical protein DMG76_08600 [Acidobacteria bacterium]|nr:MAG: hypothetical protein DMG76_08600 [Acidobacteriota bacterium]